MFSGYHSGEESSPEPEGFGRYCLGALPQVESENCTVDNENNHPKCQENLTHFVCHSIPPPAKDVVFYKKASPISTLRLRNYGNLNIRSSLHSQQANRADLFQAFFSEIRSGLPHIKPKKSGRMSLDGLLVSTEAFWNWFGPLQRVIIIALTLAATSALRQRDDNKQVRSLEAALQDRERECNLLHDKVRQLQEHLSFWKENVIPFYSRPCSGSNADDQDVVSNEATPKCDSVILEQFATPQVWQRSELNTTRFTNKYSMLHSYTTKSAPLNQCESSGKDSRWNVTSAERAPFLERLSKLTTANVHSDDAPTPSIPLEKLIEMATPQWPISRFLLNEDGLTNQGMNEEPLCGGECSKQPSCETVKCDRADSNGVQKGEPTKLDVGSDAWKEALEDVNKTLSLCIEDCHTKDIKISRLEEEINILHGIISDLRTLQVNQVTGQVDASSLQTFVTSNVLYNLEMSPVEVADTTEISKCVPSPWKEITRLTDSFELSMTRDSLENEQNSYADVESCKSQGSPNEYLVEMDKERIDHIICSSIESSFELSESNDPEKKYGLVEVESFKSEVVKSGSGHKKPGCEAIFVKKSFPKSRKTNGDTDGVRWSSSSTEQTTPMRTGNTSQRESVTASSVGRYDQPRNKADRCNMMFTSPTRPARKLRYSSSVSSSYSLLDQIADASSYHKAGGRPDVNCNDSEQYGDNVNNLTCGMKKSERDIAIKINNISSNVLSGVEPNTINKRDGKWVSKNKHLRNSLDSLNKANENRGQRKRWI